MANEELHFRVHLNELEYPEVKHYPVLEGTKKREKKVQLNKKTIKLLGLVRKCN